MIARSKHTERDPTVPLNESRGFPATLLANALFPLILFLPAWKNWDIYEHHGYLGFYALTPLLMIVVLVISSRPGTSIASFATPKNRATPDEDLPWVLWSFITTGVLATLLHLTVVGTALLTPMLSLKDLSLSRLVLPAFWKVSAMPTGSYKALLEGCHLFTQFDILVTGAAIVVFSHYLLRSSSFAVDKTQASGLKTIILGSVLLGPAAAGSFTFAVREVRMRERAQLERKTMVH